jgi:CRISPR-associated protein Cas8b1/Cst1 subtype I-B
LSGKSFLSDDKERERDLFWKRILRKGKANKKIAEKVVELTTGGKIYSKIYCKGREKTVKL